MRWPALVLVVCGCSVEAPPPPPAQARGAVLSSLGELSAPEYETWTPVAISGLNTATDRAGYLTAWSEYGPGNKLAIMAARLALDGGLIDTEGLLAFEGTHTQGPQLNVVASKGNFVVVWSNQDALLGVRVAPDGTVLDAAPFTIMTAPVPGSLYAHFPQVVADGGIVVAWTDTSAGARAWVRAFDGFPPSTATSDVLLGSGGIGESRAGDTNVLVPINNSATGRSALVSNAGALQLSTGTTATDVEGSSAGWNGSTFLVGWRSASIAQVRAARITPAGAVLDTPAFVVHTPPTGYVTHVHGAGINDRHVVQWQEPTGVFSARFDAGETVSVKSPVFQGAVLHTNHAPATHPGGALTAYVVSDRGGRVWSTRYDSEALPIPGSQARLSHIINPQRGVATASALGETWLAWLEDIGPGVTGHVRVARLPAAGALPIASPDLLATAPLGPVHPRVLALGPNALALWAEGAQLRAATTNGVDGGWSASAQVTASLDSTRQPAAAVSSTDYAFVYGPSGQPWTFRRVDAAGTLGAAVTVAPSGTSKHPALLAVDGGFTFFEGTDVYRIHDDAGVQRIDGGLPGAVADALLGVSRSDSDLLVARARLGTPAGIELFVLDPSDLRVVQTLPTIGVDAGITGLDVLFDGYRHAVVWSAGTRVSGVRVHDGAVVGSPFALGDGTQPRFVRAQPSEWTWVIAGPHGPRRLDRLSVKKATFDAVGTACGSANDCASGFCVDGVCCNEACGGGAADCQTCAGGVSGVCAPVLPGVQCRAGQNACDPAEVCNGVALTCPADVVNTCDAGTPDAGPTSDAGAPADAGSTSDAGSTFDAGTTSDAGATSDAGTTSDAGATSDAGSTSDAGTTFDAGSTSDAGRPDAGVLVPVDGGLGPADPTGCGCSTGGDPAALLMGVLGLALMGRRRRATA